MCAQFREARHNDGFDDSERPPWLVLSPAFPKTVMIEGAVGWTVSSTAPAMVRVFPASVSQQRQELSVFGLVRGEASIVARSPQGQVITLRVLVRDLVTYKLGFYLVSDTATSDSAGHHTERTEADVDTALQDVIAIYLPQALICFSKLEVRPVTCLRNLGRSIQVPGGNQGLGREFESLAEASQDRSLRSLSVANHPDFRVFFVWALTNLGGRRRDDMEGVGEIGGTNLMVEDRLGAELAVVLAHEIGHLLGVEHRGGEHRGWLMYPTTQGVGRKIPKRHAAIMNP